MKVQFDKSQYSTVGRSGCLVCVQWMKDQSRTVNPCLFKCMYRHGYVCLGCVCVCGGGGGCGVWVGVTLGYLAPVICKNHEL